MRVLVITRNAWDDTNAIGNTISNFLGGIEGIEFASIYFRSAQPGNTVCSRYYRTSETEVLKKWFSPDKIGRSFVLEKRENVERKTSLERKEKKLIRVIQKYGVKSAYRLSDCIWYSKKWINQNLEEFIRSFSPDLVFAFVKAAPQYYLTIRYLRERFNSPLMTWIADDEYTAYLKRNARREIGNLQYILEQSSVVFGCSEEICTYYNSVFGCQATPLYKGCDLSAPLNETVNAPIRIVYAGNLLYGRLEILRILADAVEEYTANEHCAALDIYSVTELSPEDQAFFEQKERTCFRGARDYDTIKEKLAEADIVLHVESFHEEEILKTKYSFSTKIIDCLQSGSVLLGIGPRDLASIRYIHRIPGACVIEDRNQVRSSLYSLLDDASGFFKRAKQIRDFAEEFHDAKLNSQELEKQMTMIITGGR